tara:strand:+ start:39 stop:1268 length:1230 start_codon:yes stop_codon:yes gene_type:complete
MALLSFLLTTTSTVVSTDVNGVAYFGSLNGTTVTTATVNMAGGTPTLALDPINFPRVETNGAVAWIAVSDTLPNSKRHPFAVIAVRSKNMTGGGAILSHIINKNTGQLSSTPISSTAFAPVHIAIDPSSAQWLIACDYGGGTCASFTIDPSTHSIGAKASSTVAFSVEPNPPSPRQNSSHPHQARFAPGPKGVDGLSGPFTIFIPDLGGDRVHHVELDAASGVLTLIEGKSLVFPRGKGPRHMKWSPSLEHAYVVCELSNEIAVFDYDGTIGEFTSTMPRQFISTLAPDHPVAEFSKAAEIAISQDGKKLFAANRGNQSIAAYSISTSGALMLHSTILGVAWPRDIAVLGNSLLAIERDATKANGGTTLFGGVAVYDLDGDSPRAPGAKPRQMIEMPSPASFVFHEVVL